MYWLRTSVRLQWVFCCLGLLVAGWWEGAQARSTVVARFAGEGIAGPQIEQHLSLYLHYFPGDGEAIRRAEISYDQEAVQLRTARSALGQVRVGEGVLGVEYESRPLGKESVDTLALELVGRRAEVETRWQARIYSSGDTSGVPAHAAVFALRIQPPVAVEAGISPVRVFPGEQVQVELVLRNADGRGRKIEAAAWEWPAGVVVEEGAVAKRWPEGLLPGQQDTLRWRVRLGGQVLGPLLLRGRLDTDRLIGSPLPAAVLAVAAAPQLRVRAGAEWLEVRQRCRLQCEWVNPGPDSLEVAELAVEIPAAFEEVVLTGPTDKAQVVPPQGNQKGAIRVQEVGILAPGQAVQVELSTRALRPGLFAWKGFFRPAGEPGLIPLEKEALVRVVQAAGSQAGGGRVEALPTDLELVSLALAEGLERQLQDLPLLPGAVLYLEPAQKGTENWLVEDVLAAALMRRGVQIALAPPAAAGSARCLRYRLAEARVVYLPAGKGWNPFRSRIRREAGGDLFLRLEGPAREVEWARRVLACRADQVPAAAAKSLGGSEAVKRTVVAADHKMIERVLSGSILGGLAYIFFIP